MASKRITLKEAIKFHGHLGPWLVLGILMGELALKKIAAKKYFGLEVKVWGANQKPSSCLIDGLQLSTGATYGKGNIEKFNWPRIEVKFYNCLNHKKIIVRLKDDLLQELKETKTHIDAQILAKKLYKTNYKKLFNLTSKARS